MSSEGIGAVIIGAVLVAVGIGSGNSILAVPFALCVVVAMIAGGFAIFKS